MQCNVTTGRGFILFSALCFASSCLQVGILNYSSFRLLYRQTLYNFSTKENVKTWSSCKGWGAFLSFLIRFGDFILHWISELMISSEGVSHTELCQHILCLCVKISVTTPRRSLQYHVVFLNLTQRFLSSLCGLVPSNVGNFLQFGTIML